MTIVLTDTDNVHLADINKFNLSNQVCPIDLQIFFRAYLANQYIQFQSQETYKPVMTIAQLSSKCNVSIHSDSSDNSQNPTFEGGVNPQTTVHVPVP